MTTDWNEIREILRKTGAFMEEQLGSEQTALPTLSGKVQGFVTGIGRMKDGERTPVGSGVLVRTEYGRHDVLTAGHVFGVVHDKEDVFLFLPVREIRASPG